MTTPTGTSCTLPFEVKDKDAFIRAMDAIPGVSIQEDEETTTEGDERTLITLGAEDGYWPTFILSDDTDAAELDLPALVAEHLVDGEVAIFLSISGEGMYSAAADGVAVNNCGGEVVTSFDTFIEHAYKTLGDGRHFVEEPELPATLAAAAVAVCYDAPEATPEDLE